MQFVVFYYQCVKYKTVQRLIDVCRDCLPGENTESCALPPPEGSTTSQVCIKRKSGRKVNICVQYLVVRESADRD